MTPKLRIFLLVGLLAILINLVRKIRSRKIELKYTLLCLFLVVTLLILVLTPELLEDAAEFLGIYSPVNMLFFLGFVFSLMIIFSLSATVSKMSEEIKMMAQKIALLDGRVTGVSDQKKSDFLENDEEKIMSDGASARQKWEQE